MSDSVVNIGLYITYALFFLAVAAVILFPLYYMIVNFKRAKGGLLGFAILVALLVVSIAVSPAQQGLLYEKFGITPMQSQMIGGALLATYLLFAGILLAAIYTEIAKTLK